jgi:hypothetical protein
MPWILNCNIYNKMEPRDNVNHSEENQEDQNPNPPQPPNANTQIDEGLVILRTLEEQLRDTREPSRVSLATSLDIIVKFITSAQGKLALFLIIGKECMSTIALVWVEIESKNWAFQNNKYCLFLGILEMDKNYH